MAIRRIAKLFFFAATLLLCSIMPAAQTTTDPMAGMDMSAGTTGQPGTPHYITQVNNIQYNDSTPDCTQAKNKVCFHTVSTSPSIQKVTTGADGAAFGLDASGSVWSLPVNSKTWQTTAYSPMVQLSAVSASDVYGLQYDATYCAAPHMRAYRYTGGANFEPLNFCADYIAAAPQNDVGDVLFRILSGAVSHELAGSTTWVSDPTAGGNGTPVEIAAGSAFNVWLVTSTQVIKELDITSGNFAVVAGAAVHVSTTGDPVQGNEETWVTNSALSVFKYSSATGSLTGTWTQMAGQLTGISVGNHYYVFGLRSDLNATYHFNAIQVMANIATTGYYQCSPQCPQGSFHTATVTGTWSNGGHYASGSNAGVPSATLNALASPYTDDCDVILGDTSGSCDLTVSGAVNCSAMGAIYFAAGSTSGITIEPAQTRVIANGALSTSTCRTVFGAEECQQPVKPWCSNTANPDLNPLNIWTQPPQWTATWDDSAVCFRFSLFGYKSAWHCSPGVAPRNPTILMRPDCTYNP